MKRVLFIACSQRKRRDRTDLPALERYDGPNYRVLRKFIKMGGTAPQVYIISAEHGLISDNARIGSYDRRLTLKRAEQLRPSISKRFSELLRHNSMADVMVCASGIYLSLLDICRLKATATVTLTSGSIGGQASQLRKWLYGTGKTPTIASKSAIGGIPVTWTAEQALEAAHQHIGAAGRAATRIETWFVKLGDQHISPKWLVSVLTKLPVSRFRSADAIAVLSHIGIAVERT